MRSDRLSSSSHFVLKAISDVSETRGIASWWFEASDQARMDRIGGVLNTIGKVVVKPLTTRGVSVPAELA